MLECQFSTIALLAEFHRLQVHLDLLAKNKHHRRLAATTSAIIIIIIIGAQHYNRDVTR